MSHWHSSSGGGVLYKSPISFAAGNTASAQSGFLDPLRTQAASVYTAVQDFWNGIFGTRAPEAPVVNLEALPPKVAPSTPALGGSTAKLPPSPVVGTTTAPTVPPRVVERVIERIPVQSVTRVLSGVSATDLASQISTLRNELLNEIAKGKATAVQDNNALYLAMAPMNRINNLSSVTLSNPTITGASITSGTLSGSFSGSVSGSTGSFDTLGIGTTTPSDTFAINGVTYLAQVSAPAVTTNRLYNTNGDLYWNGSIVGGGTVGQWTLSGSDVYRASGNVGIGTTSPYAKLSVAGEVVGSYFTATSSTASTFPYASTTAITVSGNSYLGTVSSGVWNGTAIGLAYGGTGATTATGVQNALGLMYSTSTDVISRTNIAAWGDSLTYNQAGYPLQLGVLSGMSVYNGGVSGENSTQIKNRMLAATDKYSYPTIIWAGRNNYSSPTTVKADIAAMVAALTTDRYIILSVLNGSTEPSGSGNYTTIITLNNDLAALYGSHYIDIRAYLIANGLTDAGITPTAQDITDISNDVIPSSLRTDTQHLTTAGYGSLAKRINQSISLLQKATASVLTPESLLMLNNNGIFQKGNRVLFASTTDYSTLSGIGAGAYLNGTGTYNTANGYLALNTATSSSYNTAIGATSLQSNTTGYENTGVGHQSLWLNTTGYKNTAVGSLALWQNTTGAHNVSIGSGSLGLNTTGSYNIGIGASAVSTNATQNYNIGIGYFALRSETDGYYNVAIGRNAGYGDGTTVDQRSVKDISVVFIGDTASRDASVLNTTVLTNITAIGKNARVGASNSMALGGMYADSVKVGIGTSTPYAKLSVHASNGETNKTLFAIASSTASATTTLLSVLNTGNVGIGTAAPLKALQVIGDIRAGTSGSNGCLEGFDGTLIAGTCSSDVSLKTNIQPIGSVLADLTQLTPSTFYWNDIAGNELHNSTTTKNYGLIAQDVARVLPNMVATTSNGYLGVNYSMLPILTLQGLKELDLNLEGLASTTAVTVDATGNKTFVGRFFDRITGWLADAANGIGEVVARVFRGKEFHAEEKICIGQQGNETCVTKDQLDALLLGKSVSNNTSTTVNMEATTTPIVISINGNNPAMLHVGDRYGDLGALITAPESAKNFGIKASLDGGPELDISQISLDTSVAGSHTIVYSVVDQNNATTTVERVVNVVAPTPVETVATTTQPIETPSEIATTEAINNQ